MRISLLGLAGSLWGFVLSSYNVGAWLLGSGTSETQVLVVIAFLAAAVAFLATAAVSVLDTEWPSRKARFERWLSPDNFDAAGRQRSPLSSL